MNFRDPFFRVCGSLFGAVDIWRVGVYVFHRYHWFAEKTFSRRLRATYPKICSFFLLWFRPRQKLPEFFKTPTHLWDCTRDRRDPLYIAGAIVRVSQFKSG